MAAWKCGWCGKLAHMNPVGDGWGVPLLEGEVALVEEGYDSRVYSSMVCASCQGYSVAWVAYSYGASGAFTLGRMRDFWRERTPTEVAPKWVEGQDFDYAPAHIRKAASEAYRCHSINAYMAAILMARTSIEAAAKDKGIREGRLVQKIDQLAEEGEIRPSIKKAAHQIRKFGNDMAHGDIDIEVNQEDSLQVLRLLTFILQDLYEVESLMSEVGISLDERKPENKT